MEKFEICTPGHNSLTDTLIMWGLYSLFRECDCSPEDITVIGEHDRYRIIVADASQLEGLRDVLLDCLEDKLLEVLDSKLTNAWDRNTISGVKEAAVKVTQLLESKDVFDISKIFSDDHIYQYDEGRRGKGFKTLYVPLSGIYGKFLTEEHIYKEAPYKVCPYCLVFSALGFSVSVGVVRKKTLRTYIAVGFNGELTGRVLEPFLFEEKLWYQDGVNLLERAFRANASLTTLSVAFTTFLSMPDACLENIRESGSSWYTLIYSYDVGMTKRLTGFDRIDITPFKDAIIAIESHYDLLRGLVSSLLSSREVVDHGGDTVVNLLSDFALNRKLINAFNSLRALRSVVERLQSSKHGEMYSRLSSYLSHRLGLGFIAACD